MNDNFLIIYQIIEQEKLQNREIYAAMLYEDFEPFEQFEATSRSHPDSFNSDLVEDLSRSPLFAALRLPRPSE